MPTKTDFTSDFESNACSTPVNQLVKIMKTLSERCRRERERRKGKRKGSFGKDRNGKNRKRPSRLGRLRFFPFLPKLHFQFPFPPFPSSFFPFLFLSLPLPLPLTFRLRLKNLTLRIYPFINYSFRPCAMHNGDRDGFPERSGFSLWALDNAYVAKWRQNG